MSATRHRPERIAVGVDGSIASHRAVCWAIDHARPGDVVTLVHAAAPAPGIAADVDDGGRAFLRHELARFACLPRQPGVSLEGELLDGDPGERLCAVEADLLLVGASRHGRLTGALLGSVATYLARHATTPLVLVPAPSGR